MNIALWLVQGLLAAMFLMVGSMKLMKTKEEMSAQMGWVKDFSQKQIRGIGTLEVLAVLGLILPPLFGILTWLTPLAALGLVLTMIGAGLTHFRRKEYSMIGMNAMLLLLAAFVAYGRWFIAPF